MRNPVLFLLLCSAICVFAASINKKKNTISQELHTTVSIEEVFDPNDPISLMKLWNYTSSAKKTLDNTDIIYTTSHDGLDIVAVDFLDIVKWSTKLSSYSSAIITHPITYYNGILYIGASTLPSSIMSPFRGFYSALDIETGKIVWTSYFIPESIDKDIGWSGAAISDAPTAIDPNNNQIIISTGGLYGAPSYINKCKEIMRGATWYFADPCHDHRDNSNSFIALDLETGKQRWAVPFKSIAGNLCNVGQGECSSFYSDIDNDSNLGLIFVRGGKNTPDGRNALFGCQKSGICFCISSQSGIIHWTAKVN